MPAARLAGDRKLHRHTHALHQPVVAACGVFARAVVGGAEVAVLLGLEGQQAPIGIERGQQRGRLRALAHRGAGAVLVHRLPVHRAAGQQGHRVGRALQQPAPQRDAVQFGRAGLIDQREGRPQLGLHVHAAIDEGVIGPGPDAGQHRRGGGKHQRRGGRRHRLVGRGRLEAGGARAPELALHLDVGHTMAHEALRKHKGHVTLHRQRQLGQRLRRRLQHRLAQAGTGHGPAVGVDDGFRAAAGQPQCQCGGTGKAGQRDDQQVSGFHRGLHRHGQGPSVGSAPAARLTQQSEI